MDFTLTFNRNGKDYTRGFSKLQDLIRYVVMNDVKDEEFNSLETPKFKIEDGINGLKNELLAQAAKMDEYDAMEFFDEDDDVGGEGDDEAVEDSEAADEGFDGEEA